MAHYRKLKINGEVYEYHVGKLFVVIRNKNNKKKVALWADLMGTIRPSYYCDCGSTDCLAHSYGWQVRPSDIRKWIVANWIPNLQKKEVPKLISQKGKKRNQK